MGDATKQGKYCQVIFLLVYRADSEQPWGRKNGLKCLETAHRRGYTNFFHTRVDADLDPIRADPRFKAILDKYDMSRKTNQPGKRNSGSAGVLIGPVSLNHLFVDDRESMWSKKERDQARVHLEAAADFLSLNARQYDIKLNIVPAYREGLMYDPGLPTDMFVNHAWTEGVLALTGTPIGNDLVLELKKKHKVRPRALHPPRGNGRVDLD